MLAAWRPLPTVNVHGPKNVGQILQPSSTSPAPNTNEEYQCLAGLSPAVANRALGQANVVFRQVGSWAHDWYKKSLEAACCIPAVVEKWPICPATANDGTTLPAGMKRKSSVGSLPGLEFR